MKTGKILLVFLMSFSALFLMQKSAGAATEQHLITETEDFHIEWIALEEENRQVSLRVGDYYASSDAVELEVPEKIGDLTVTRLADDAFAGGFDSIAQITLPQTVTVIGARAFYGCSGLRRIGLSPELTTIGEGAFADCVSLNRIYLPDKVKSVGTGAFAGTPLKEVRLSPDNSKYRVTDGVLFDAKGTTLLCYPAGREDESYRIPEGTVSVADEAFSGSKNLVRVFLPDTLTSVGENVFADCALLRYCRIPAGLTGIGAGAFRGTAVSRFIVDGNNKRLKSIDGVLFGNGELLVYPPQKDETEYTLPKDVTVIGRYAFLGNPYLQQLTLNDGQHWIGEGAFSGCTALKKVYIPASVSELGAKAFADCSCLAEVRFHPDSAIGSIYEETFRNCVKLTEISLPAGITYLGLSAFSGCERLSAVDLPDSLVMIADGAFEECRSLKSMAIPRNVEEIGTDVFSIKPDKVLVYYNTLAWRWALRNGVTVEILREPIEVYERTDSNILIMKVQKALNELGYDCGKTDGKIGRRTRAAMEAFRKDYGLEEGQEIDRALLDALGL